jgi:chromosome segregation ATPase
LEKLTKLLIKLKLEIESKKKRISEQGAELEILTKNAKSKIISELENEYIVKCEQHKNLLKAIKKMEELIKSKEKDITDLENEYNYQKDYYSKLNTESKKSEEQFEKSEKEKNKLKNEILEMTNKQKKIKDTLNKNKKEIDNNEMLLQKRRQIEDINKYKEIRKREK